jgi:hypothetical protein
MIQIGDMNGDGLTLLVLNWFEVKKQAVALILLQRNANRMIHD